MDTATMTVNTNKRHVIQSYHDEIFIIEFAEPQDVLPEEEYAYMIAYECYILDNDYEAESRAIYYYAEDDRTQYLKYREDPTDPKLTTVWIRNIVAISPGMSIEEVLANIEDQEEPDSKLSMSDIC